MSCFCGECPFCLKPTSNLNVDIKQLQTELSAAKAENERLLRLNGHVAGENARLRDALEKVAGNHPALWIGPPPQKDR